MAILDPIERERRIREVQSAFMPGVTNFSHECGSITAAAGHANGIRVSTNITTEYRRFYRPNSMNVTPNEVVEALVNGGIKQWVLMGLHGYVGYLAQPRATQDVDVMIGLDEQENAQAAILARWPGLEVKAFPVVIRFIDPVDRDAGKSDGHVIDLMLPNNACQFAILEKYYRVDDSTGHRIPTLEGALAAKYSALVSPNRGWEKKYHDAGDLRNIIIASNKSIDKSLAHMLGDLVFPGGGDELLEFIQLAIDQKPFPV